MKSGSQHLSHLPFCPNYFLMWFLRAGELMAKPVSAHRLKQHQLQSQLSDPMKTILQTDVLLLPFMYLIFKIILIFFFFFAQTWPVKERPLLLFTFLSLICQVLLDRCSHFCSLWRGVNVNSPATKHFTNGHKEGYETVN